MDTQTVFPSSIDVLTDTHREELERSGLEFDEQGNPVWYTVDEWIDELDKKLVSHFGDEYRELANKRRWRWNMSGSNFSRL